MIECTSYMTVAQVKEITNLDTGTPEEEKKLFYND